MVVVKSEVAEWVAVAECGSGSRQTFGESVFGRAYETLREFRYVNFKLVRPRFLDSLGMRASGIGNR